MVKYAAPAASVCTSRTVAGTHSAAAAPSASGLRYSTRSPFVNAIAGVVDGALEEAPADPALLLLLHVELDDDGVAVTAATQIASTTVTAAGITAGSAAAAEIGTRIGTGTTTTALVSTSSASASGAGTGGPGRAKTAQSAAYDGGGSSAADGSGSAYGGGGAVAAGARIAEVGMGT